MIEVSLSNNHLVFAVKSVISASSKYSVVVVLIVPPPKLPVVDHSRLIGSGRNPTNVFIGISSLGFESTAFLSAD